MRPSISVVKCATMAAVQRIRKFYFKHISFKNLLLLSNFFVNISGFFCIYINPTTFERGSSRCTYFLYALNFAFSLVASVAYRAYIPIATITHSEILEVIYNLHNYSSVLFLGMFKVFNFFNHQRFLRILRDLQWCNVQVSPI